MEQSASPLMAFLISPLAQFVFMPFMSEGGAGAAAIGSWFGTGPARGIALVLMLLAIGGLVLTAVALGSRQYRALSGQYAAQPDDGEAVESDDVPTTVGQLEPALAGAAA
jgi:DHA3 family multidrug efflux protein-like MFS transporter